MRLIYSYRIWIVSANGMIYERAYNLNGEVCQARTQSGSILRGLGTGIGSSYYCQAQDVAVVEEGEKMKWWRQHLYGRVLCHKCAKNKPVVITEIVKEVR